MFGCVLGQIRFRDPDFLSVELVEGTRVITGPKCNKVPSVITFEPKCNETCPQQPKDDYLNLKS